MKNKKMLHIICISSIFFLALGTYIITVPKEHINNKLCKATVSFKLTNEDHDFHYRLAHRIRFSVDGKGYNHMRGVVYKDNEQYIIARTLSFDFQARDKNKNYEAKIGEIRKTGQDTLPDVLVSKYLSYTLPGSFIFFRVDDINNHLALVSGSQGPIFICSF